MDIGTQTQRMNLTSHFSLTLVMAMFPFWWFRVMDPLVDAYQNKDRKPSKEQL